MLFPTAKFHSLVKTMNLFLIVFLSSKCLLHEMSHDNAYQQRMLFMANSMWQKTIK